MDSLHTVRDRSTAPGSDDGLPRQLGAINWTEKVQGLLRVKHVGIKFQVVRQALQNRLIRVPHVPSAENKADPFTKRLIGEVFENHRGWMSVRPNGPPQ